MSGTQDEEDQCERGQQQRDDLADVEEVELVESNAPGATPPSSDGIGTRKGRAFDGDNVAAFG
jgi:hypothetical protein